ncbi:MAG TPA: DNA translocase FtsK [Candidatus Absconditabacterales bacterium]|nr:DNA translocase FtsK [Candidatus Absconditabacterales bacterium]
MARRRKKKNIVLNKFKLGISLTVLGSLFFFSLYFAEGSPVLMFLRTYASIAFGEVGLYVFFALCFLVGIIIMAKGYLMKLVIRQFMVIIVIISAVINFPIIDGDVAKYEKFGGYISWPVIALLQVMFGGKAIATKSFIIILLILAIIWILYSLNFSFPNISLKTESKPKSSPKARPQRYEEEEEEEERPEFGKPVSRSLIKSLIKDKLQRKIEEKEETKERKIRPTINFSADKPTFNHSILESNADQTVTIDETFLMEKAKALQNKLMEFNVPIMIEGFDIGPSIVQIRIKPDEGIRLSTIEGLSNDISLSLKSKSVRIVAPIPGTDCVGIQLPNPKPLMVHLADVLSTSEFANDMKKSDNNLALGKAIDGSIIIKTLESMPHLLVAGATGSGKSVGVNDFILSLMYQNTPSELKFLMVDPKQVELELYAGLPYLLAPIVFEPEKALKLLKWTEQEMERRYGILKENRVKNLDEYNKKLPSEKMFRIVFVIDELASMMLSKAKRDVENCITHISAKARAVGIHLIIATQRPSVDVITGLIKANIPTRIAFGTVSDIDSRTILGKMGAETLLGKGDMLYMDPSTKSPIRIQAPFISTDEIEKVVMALKTKYMGGLTEEDIYNQEIVGLLDNKLEAGQQLFGSNNGDNDDELVERAIQVISQTRKASATLLQRKLGVGFARAARIMDILEEKGIIGPQDGAKPRDIFI